MVLVVDDEFAVARAISRVVVSLGFTVETVNDPLDVEAVLLRAPVAVLSDYAMPHRNGEEVLRLAKELAPGALRVLVTATPVDGLELAHLEPLRLLLKPFATLELAELLQGLRPH